MSEHSLEAIRALVGEHDLQGSATHIAISHVRSVGEAEETSLAWIDPQRPDKQQLLDNTRAAIVIGDPELKLAVEKQTSQALITVANPKLAMVRVVSALFETQPESGVHPTAVVHPEARIADSAYIGPNTYIGRAEIGANSVVHGNTYIYDNVRVGERVQIQAGCVIGVAGLSLVKDDAGVLHNLPHLGGVVIEDDVELQALCVIDRGVFGDTVIGAGSKINSGVYIGHNARIGHHNFIAGHTMISGSVVTGDHCWFAPAVVTRDRIRIGEGAFIGTGSVVVNSLDRNTRVMGNPAKPIDEVKRLLRHLKRLNADEPLP